MFTTCYRCVLRFLLLLAGIFCWACATSTATASCGDHLEHGASQVRDPIGTWQSQGDSATPVRRCSGPQCGRHPASQPWAPTSLVVDSQLLKWLLPVDLALRSVVPSLDGLPSFVLQHSTAPVHRLDRPPEAMV